MSPSFGLAHWIKRPSLWLCAISSVLCLIPVSSIETSGYSQTVLGQSTLTFYIMAPATAAAVAWEMSRFQAVINLGSNAIRKIIVSRILLFSFFPTLGYLLAVLFLGNNLRFSYSITFLEMVSYSYAVGISWVAIGCTFGLILRPLIAVSLSATAAYAWYALLPSATPPGPVRRMVGDLIACCSLNSVLDSRTIFVAAGTVVSVALMVIGLAIGFKVRPINAMPIFITGLAFLIGSGLINSNVNASGVIDRDHSDMLCTDDVCAWPEVSKNSVDLNAQAREIFRQIAPLEWKHYADGPVTWGDVSKQNLEFSGQRSLEGVLGDYVDYIGSLELARSGSQLCGVSAQEIGIVRSTLPWNPAEQIEISKVEQRLSQALCPVQG